MRAGESLDDLRKTAFLDQISRLFGVEPSGFSGALLWPLIKLLLDPEQENSHLAEDRLLGKPLLVMKAAVWPLAHNTPDQPGFFICLLAGDLGRFRPFIGHPWG